MERILLFPGADAIEDDSIRAICSRIPEIRHELDFAQDILQHAGINLDLLDFMTCPKRPSGIWFHKLVVATVAVQVGLYKMYVRRYGTPDYVLGCSLGDISRNICVGSTNYEDSILGMSDFADAFTKMDVGGSVHATFAKSYTDQALSRLGEFKLAASILQTPNHMMIAGRYEDVARWVASEPDMGHVKLRELYPYPLHSPLMASCYEKIETRLLKSPIEKWTNIRIFSAVEQRFLTDVSQIRAELKTNILSTVFWHQSISYIQRNLPSIQFCNLGPTPTLVYFHKKTLGPNVPIFDFFAELRKEYEVVSEIVV